MTEHNDTTRQTGQAEQHDPQVDLTPRSVDAPLSASRRLVPKLVGVAVVVALGFVLFQSLGDAALFFYNADEAVERRAELVGQRFRVQGTAFGEAQTSEIDVDGTQQVVVSFPITFEGQSIDVVHTGSPAELFAPGIPVVLEGVWTRGFPAGLDAVEGGAGDGWHFASNEMVVKHDNEYRANDDRITDAERGGYAPEQ